MHRRRPATPRWLLAGVTLAAALVTLLLTSTAQAIPAFARRYQTSCQTCHLAFPKLTPFGEAYRRNGYRFPGGGDLASEKEEPLSLGAEAQKDVWPRAVWPGQLPTTVPISMILDAKGAYGPSLESHSHGAAMAGMTHVHPTSALSFQDSMARIVGGGSLGTIGAYFGAVSFGGHTTAGLERGFVILTPIDATSLHVKAGLFEPALHGISLHRGLLGHQLRLTTTPVMLNTFVPEAAVRGVETSGLVAGHLGWAAGLVENAVPLDRASADVYGRVEVKLGGMRLDGAGATAATAAWRERSFSLGMSGYRGRSKVSFTNSVGTTTTHDDTFIRFGADAHAVLDDLLLDFVAVRQRHDAPEHEGESATMDLAYAEATYVLFPWLFPTLRFEANRVLQSGSEIERHWIGILALNTVLRPNLVLRAEGAGGQDPGHMATFRFAALSVSVGF